MVLYALHRRRIEQAKEILFSLWSLISATYPRGHAMKTIWVDQMLVAEILGDLEPSQLIAVGLVE